LVYLVKGYLVYKGTSKGLVLSLGTGFCGGLTTFSSLMLDFFEIVYGAFSISSAMERKVSCWLIPV
jgi:CrcB-like protein